MEICLSEMTYNILEIKLGKIQQLLTYNSNINDRCNMAGLAKYVWHPLQFHIQK